MDCGPAHPAPRSFECISLAVRVLVSVETYQGDKYGEVTAYCEGIDGKCPDFVKNALNQ